MALIKCPECGNSVSSRATVCPVCGFPILEEIGGIIDFTAEDEQLSERETAKKLKSAVQDKDYHSVNKWKMLLDKKYSNSPYASIVNEAQELPKEKYEKYICANFDLLFQYLDYELDLDGYRRWNDAKYEKGGHGFYQVDRYSYDNFIEYYCMSDVYEIYAFEDIIKNTCLKRIAGRVLESSKSLYTIVLKRNFSKYRVLIEKSIDFIKESYDTGIIIDSISVPQVDFVNLWSEKIRKSVVDTVEMQKRYLHAAGSMLRAGLADTNRKPMGVGMSATIGAVMAGLPGAVVGIAIGEERNRKYEYAKAFNDRLKAEKEDAINALKYGDKPSKIIDVDRNYFGIKTYAGIIPIYVDADETDIYTELKYGYHNVLEGMENREKQARWFRVKDEILPSWTLNKHAVDFVDNSYSIADIANKLYCRLIELEHTSSELGEFVLLYEEIKRYIYQENIDEHINYCKSKIANDEFEKSCDMLHNATTKDDIENVKKSFLSMTDNPNATEKINECNDKINQIDYDIACELLENNKSIDNARAIFLRLGDWRDAAEKASLCNKIKRKKKNRVVFGVVSSIVVTIALIVIIIVNVTVVNPQKLHDKYIDMARNGRYEQAINELKGKTDENSKDTLREVYSITYTAAEKKFKERDFDGAKRIFEIYDSAGSQDITKNIQAREYIKCIECIEDIEKKLKNGSKISITDVKKEAEKYENLGLDRILYDRYEFMEKYDIFCNVDSWSSEIEQYVYDDDPVYIRQYLVHKSYSSERELVMVFYLEENPDIDATHIYYLQDVYYEQGKMYMYEEKNDIRIDIYEGYLYMLKTRLYPD